MGLVCRQLRASSKTAFAGVRLRIIGLPGEVAQQLLRNRAATLHRLASVSSFPYKRPVGTRTYSYEGTGRDAGTEDYLQILQAIKEDPANKLRAVSLDSDRVGRQVLKRLVSLLGGVTSLTLRNASTKSVEPIRQLTGLERLTLHGMTRKCGFIKVLDAMESTLAALTKLSVLDLGHNIISVRGQLNIVKTLPASLRELRLASTGFGSTGVAIGVTMHGGGLRVLDLSNSGMTYNAASGLALRFSSLVALEDLDLSRNEITQVFFGSSVVPL